MRNYEKVQKCVLGTLQKVHNGLYMTHRKKMSGILFLAMSRDPIIVTFQPETTGCQSNKKNAHKIVISFLRCLFLDFCCRRSLPVLFFVLRFLATVVERSSNPCSLISCFSSCQIRWVGSFDIAMWLYERISRVLVVADLVLSWYVVYVLGIYIDNKFNFSKVKRVLL